VRQAVSGVVATVAMTAASLGMATPVADAVSSRCGDTVLYAQKGGAYGTTAENTIPKLRAAFDAGYPGVEVDVRPTLDADLVVFHDKMLNGLTSSTGYVDERATPYVRAAQLDGGGQIPFYVEFLDLLVSRPGKQAIIEVKGSPHWSEDLFRTALIQPAARRGLLGRIIFESTTNKYLPIIDRVDPSAETAMKGAAARDGNGVLQNADSVVTGAGWPVEHVRQVQAGSGHVVLTSPNEAGWAEALPKNPDGLASANARQLLAWCSR